jgi:DNA helicase-2/ATP-dependent DNA helicase PcrA
VALIRLLSSPARNLFVVGDDDQVIYGFAGASPSAFPAFDDAFPDRVSYVLAENYRNPLELVLRSMSLIERNVDRIKKDVTSRKPSDPVELVSVLNVDHYAHHGVAFVTQQLNAGFAPHEIALLFRLRDMAVPVERALVAERIPHIRCSRQSFFDRKIVQQIRAWLRVSAGSTDPPDYSAALAWPTRYLRNEVLERITSFPEFRAALLRGHEEGLRWLETSGTELLNETNVHGVADFVALIRKAKERRLPAQILEVLNLRRAAESETAPASEAPPAIIVDVVHRLAAQFQTVGELETWISTRGQDKDYAIGGDEDGPSVPTRKGCVTLATIHQVKGQEFRAVGVLGPLEGMPDKRARLSAELEEERRIAYVAITRARQRLLFCASSQYAAELMASVRQ